jgi:hypothetical protein
MKKVIPFVIAALMIPSVALAKGPSPKAGTHTNHGKAKVMYVLKGMIYNYVAYDSTAGTPGSITIDVNHSNRHGKLLVGQTVTVALGANSQVLMENGVTAVAATQPGDQGMIKIRAPRMAFKGANTALMTGALSNQTAKMVIDWGAPTSS